MRLVVKDKKELEEVIKSLGLKNEDELWEVLPIVVDEDIDHIVTWLHNALLLDWYEIYMTNDDSAFIKELIDAMTLLNRLVGILTRGLEKITIVA